MNKKQSYLSAFGSNPLYPKIVVTSPISGRPNLNKSSKVTSIKKMVAQWNEAKEYLSTSNLPKLDCAIQSNGTLPPATTSEIPEVKINMEQVQDCRKIEHVNYQQRCYEYPKGNTTYGTGLNDFRNQNMTQDTGYVIGTPLTSDEKHSEKSPLISGSPKKNCRKLSTSDSYSDTSASEVNSNSRLKTILNNVKIGFLCLVMLGSVGLFITVSDKEPIFHQISVSKEDSYHIGMPSTAGTHIFPLVRTSFKGKFLPNYYDNFSDIDVFFTLQRVDPILDTVHENMSVWRQSFAPATLWQELPDSTVEHYFDLQNEKEDWMNYKYDLLVSTNNDRQPITLSVGMSEVPRTIEYGVVFAICILVCLYVIIVFDLIHRTLAALWSGVVAIGVLAFLNEKPTLSHVMSWMDIETLCLLFGMMVLVAILCETGFFDYIAVLAYKMAKGKRWTVITLLCLFTAVISAFLDNVTTILLFTPVTIRLCEAMELNPKNVLIALVMFSNIGGTATAVGDPPNVIIISNEDVAKKGIGFANFTLHMSIGSIITIFVTYFVLRFMYRNLIPLQFEEPHEVVELRREIQVWKRAAGSLSLYSRDENTVRRLLLQKVEALEILMRKKLYARSPGKEMYEASLLELEKKFRITNWPLLIKTGIVMFTVIMLFFMHSLPFMNISLGWIALIGAVFLLVLADISEIEHIFSRVEWTTLVFFGALFAVMEALNELGLLKFIGTLTENFILDIPKDYQLAVSIVLILWVSAIASSFIDNIPFTTVMIKIVLQIADNPELNLPLQPLVWALAFGACFGGNGTLIGASPNVVCAGIAEQHGFRFTFMEFFKIGFPIMLVSTSVATVYLLVCHVLLDWNYS